MKLALLSLLTLIATQTFAAPIDQQLTQQVTIVARKIPTADALKELSQLTNKQIVVSPDVQLKKTISLDARDANLSEVLDFIATEENVSWKPGSGDSIQISTVR